MDGKSHATQQTTTARFLQKVRASLTPGCGSPDYIFLEAGTIPGSGSREGIMFINMCMGLLPGGAT